jgi:hypothetical protein
MFTPLLWKSSQHINICSERGQFQAFKISDVDFDSPANLSNENQGPNPRNYEDVVNFCKMLRLHKKTHAGTIDPRILQFYRSCTFLKFYEEKLEREVYEKFLEALTLDLKEQGSFLFNMKDEDKDWIILLAGSVKAEPLPGRDSSDFLPRRASSKHISPSRVSTPDAEGTPSPTTPELNHRLS